MQKFETYKYEDGIVKLDFSFPIGPEAGNQKRIFIRLLKLAITDLQMELGEMPVEKKP